MYVDTNVFIDYLRKRSGKEPFYKYASWLFQLVKSCKFSILVSDHVEKEVLDHINENQWRKFLETLEDKVKLVKTTRVDWEEARKIGAHNMSDALHAVVASHHKARLLFTRNLSDFVHFLPYLRKYGVEVKHPRTIYSFL